MARSSFEGRAISRKTTTHNRGVLGPLKYPDYNILYIGQKVNS